MIYVVLSAIIAYLLGSVNSAIIITKLQTRKDIRTMGSANAGMTNVLRSVGKGAAIGTACFDVFKGAASVAAGYFLVSSFTELNPQYGVYAGVLFSVIGHCYPIFYGFRGGKGVLTIAGAVLVAEPLIVLILGTVFAIVLLCTKKISIGSLTIAAGYPITMVVLRLIQGRSLLPGLPTAIILGCLIIFRHRSNIRRLLAGEEGNVSVKK